MKVFAALSHRLAAAGLALGLALGFAVPANAGIDLDSIQQLKLLGRGVQPPIAIDGARFRVAVFAFDDPDNLSLGEALAALVRHEVLLGARVSSLGVLRFSNPLAPEAVAPDPGAGYFERVDLLAAAQRVTLSVWGTVRREGERVSIDTYLQIPEPTVALGLTLRLPLPQAMGGGQLVGRVGRDRVLLQHHTLTAGEAAALRAAAERLGELRDQPADNAPVARRLPRGTVYVVRELRDGSWVRLSSSAGGGWGRTAAHLCTGSCAPVLESARFANALLAFIDKRRPLDLHKALSSEAESFAWQTRALVLLEASSPAPAGKTEQAIAMLRPWSQPREGVPANSVAGSANLLLLARMSGALREAGARRGEPYDQWRVPPEAITSIAFDAAEALQDEPQNPDLLQNLALLFQLSHDTKRADLARQLLEQSRGRSRLPAVAR